MRNKDKKSHPQGNTAWDIICERFTALNSHEEEKCLELHAFIFASAESNLLNESNLDLNAHIYLNQCAGTTMLMEKIVSISQERQEAPKQADEKESSLDEEDRLVQEIQEKCEGIRFDETDARGETAWHLAIRLGCFKIAAALLCGAIKNNSLDNLLSAGSRDADVQVLLLSQGFRSMQALHACFLKTKNKLVQEEEESLFLPATLQLAKENIRNWCAFSLFLQKILQEKGVAFYPKLKDLLRYLNNIDDDKDLIAREKLFTLNELEEHVLNKEHFDLTTVMIPQHAVQTEEWDSPTTLSDADQASRSFTLIQATTSVFCLPVYSEPKFFGPICSPMHLLGIGIEEGLPLHAFDSITLLELKPPFRVFYEALAHNKDDLSYDKINEIAWALRNMIEDIKNHKIKTPRALKAAAEKFKVQISPVVPPTSSILQIAIGLFLGAIAGLVVVAMSSVAIPPVHLVTTMMLITGGLGFFKSKIEHYKFEKELNRTFRPLGTLLNDIHSMG
ncbi:MAG: hypothetical protein K0S27_1117 [Gammaproteobacteria bacterium]|nr:hypothetical protein [Gammaproteobacteria bacterium]